MLKVRFEKRFKGQNRDVETKVCEGVKRMMLTDVD